MTGKINITDNDHGKANITFGEKLYGEGVSDPSDWSISIGEEIRGSQICFQVLINLAEEMGQY